jgi:nucleoid-associated protein YgaU
MYKFVLIFCCLVCGCAKPAAESKLANKYIVQPGDTVRSISVKVYGDDKQMRRITLANPESNLGSLKVGQILKVPPATEELPPDTKADAKPTLPTEYVALPGDSLSTIARKFYGDKGDWKTLQAANQLPDPNHLRAGDTLKIPKLSEDDDSASVPQTPH